LAVSAVYAPHSRLRWTWFQCKKQAFRETRPRRALFLLTEQNATTMGSKNKPLGVAPCTLSFSPPPPKLLLPIFKMEHADFHSAEPVISLFVPAEKHVEVQIKIHKPLCLSLHPSKKKKKNGKKMDDAHVRSRCYRCSTSVMPDLFLAMLAVHEGPPPRNQLHQACHTT